MIRCVVRIVVVALCLGVSAGAQETPVFKSYVRLVRMLVTVKDANGALIGSLNKSDFAVSDNGSPQEIALFERQTEQPLSVAVLIDTSASTGIEMHYELDSVRKFYKALLGEGNPLDTAALYSFNWQTTVESSFTRRFERLDSRLRGLKSEGGTSLYDAIFFASRDLEMRDGRHVMVVVTDGGDTTSIKNFHQALEAAQMSDVIMYPVLVMPITNDAGRNIGGENALTTLSAGTGGRVFKPTEAAELDRAFADILRELRTQYLIGYYPKDVPLTKDRFHILKVNVVTGRNLRVITRSGYYGESNEFSRQGR